MGKFFLINSLAMMQNLVVQHLLLLYLKPSVVFSTEGGGILRGHYKYLEFCLDFFFFFFTPEH